MTETSTDWPGDAVHREILMTRELPEIVIPDHIKQERLHAVNRLVVDPPPVDLLIVPERSAPMALAGYELVGHNLSKIELPIGRELFNIFYAEEDLKDNESGLDCGLGLEASDEARARFRSWLETTSNQRVKGILAEIRARLQPFIASAKNPKIALVDDIFDTGSVALGITPAVLDVVLGQGGYEYDANDNRYIFTSRDWLFQIIRASFGSEGLILDDRSLNFLVELSKGYPDDYWHTSGGSMYYMHSIEEAVTHYSTMYMIGQQSEPIPKGSGSIDQIVRIYGNNLYLLHERVMERLRNDFN